jgi:hypothetical protein
VWISSCALGTPQTAAVNIETGQSDGSNTQGIGIRRLKKQKIEILSDFGVFSDDFLTFSAPFPRISIAKRMCKWKQAIRAALVNSCGERE